MRRIFGIMAVTCLTSLSTIAQTTEGFFLSKEGAKMEYTETLGAIAKYISEDYTYQTKEVTKIKLQEDGTTSVIIKHLTLDKNKKPSKLFNKKGFFTATEVFPDGSYTIGPLFFEVGTDNLISTTGYSLKIPIELQVGDSIESGISTCSSKGQYKITSTKTCYNFNVTEECDLTTPAGTFHCYVIKGNTKIDVQMKSGSVTNNSIGETTEEYWIAKGIGVVRYKVYNAEAKLSRQIELTSLSM